MSPSTYPNLHCPVFPPQAVRLFPLNEKVAGSKYQQAKRSSKWPV